MRNEVKLNFFMHILIVICKIYKNYNFDFLFLLNYISQDRNNIDKLLLTRKNFKNFANNDYKSSKHKDFSVKT